MIPAACPGTVRPMTSVPAHLTALTLSQPVDIDLDAAAVLLGEGAASWLGTPVEAPDPASRRFLTDLSLPLRDHVVGVTFRKAAFVDLSAPRSSPGRCELDISWRSSSLAPLFPVFAGKLVLTGSDLLLDGFYAPPGGDLGAVLDKAFLNIAARGTARWFLGKVAEALAGPS
jgi:hypothetical protein